MSTETTPHYLSGHLAPVPDETEAFDLPVTGALPPELTGRYFRNGPNPRPGEDPGHWFGGHGMLHGVRLRDGRAEWYRNRWVRTGKLAGDPFVRPDGTLDRAAVSANTHVIGHAGRILALVEAGLPYEVTRGLDTVGPVDFGGRLTTAMTAHPKQDPVTGDLHFFGYGALPPYLTYHRLDTSGALVRSREIEVPGGTMMHDFAITEHHVVWLDLPLTFHADLVARGMPYQWDDAYGARLGLMRHDGADVQWFDIEPCYVFHVGNAHEESGRVVLDAVRYGRAEFAALWGAAGGSTSPADGSEPSAMPRLYRWTLDPSTGTVAERPLDDRGIEFPTLDDARVGRPARHLYAAQENAVVKYDLATGAATAHTLPEDTAVGEAVFVPATRGPRREDDGWLLTITTRRDASASRLLVLDASDPSGPPVAAVDLPRAVPAGFHGSWLPDDPA
ncbi:MULTISPECIES: carotenoid oxygenase family protein [Actinomadura]|uniref:Dioxygenase n=1 Tax=Actinomadura yumaensis TaxID=111807 RepID=A0ABW2CN78_9ACTN|nr:carotenoid oxygenase family protein [Actinomadura sp. J1-007]MWK36765.1 dioxygenase [Actinomadura sp. J1-007]